MSTQTKVVIEKNGLFWGVLYEDGQSTSYGWVPFEQATQYSGEYLKEPKDATYRGSHDEQKLQGARVRRISIQIRLVDDV